MISIQKHEIKFTDTKVLLDKHSPVLLFAYEAGKLFIFVCNNDKKLKEERQFYVFNTNEEIKNIKCKWLHSINVKLGSTFTAYHLFESIK